jgi:hypothetical protein
MRGLGIYLKVLRLLFTVVVFCFCSTVTFSQPPLPQRSLTVLPTQSIHFGTLCSTGGAGGTVILGFDGSRTSTGDILLLAIAPASQPAIFEVKLCQGRNIIITFSPTATLTNGTGGSLLLHIGPTDKGISGAYFPTNADCNFITTLRVGGTLDIPAIVPTGVYTGTFNIIFNQE